MFPIHFDSLSFGILPTFRIVWLIVEAEHVYLVGIYASSGGRGKVAVGLKSRKATGLADAIPAPVHPLDVRPSG